MEKLRKTAIISALIYGLYGLVSLLNLGVFIPPLPLKPFLFTVLLLSYILSSQQDFSPLLSISVLIWMTSLIFVGQYFVETFFDYATVDFYLNNVEPLVLMGSITAFILMIYKLVREMAYASLQFFLPVTIAGLLIPLTLFIQDQIVFDWGMIVVAFLFFIFEKLKRGNSTTEKHEKVLLVLYSVAAITIIERVTYLL